MRIGEVQVGNGHPPMIVAELSANHNGSLERAMDIVDAVAAAGAHAIKLQTYTPEAMTLDLDTPAFRVSGNTGPWSGRTLHDLYREAQTPWEWHAPLFERAHERGLVAFSSVFDVTSLDFLEVQGVPAYKIASFENVDLPLIRAAAATRKPLIVSTGMATLQEIEAAVNAAREAGCTELALLKCTSTYPAAPDDSHLATMADLRARFDCVVGLSDHSEGIGVSVAAAAMGASIIERHVTLSRADGGPDASFSMEPHELASLVAEAHRAWQSVGSIHYGPTNGERAAVAYRRSLRAVVDIRAGEAITATNVRSLRPAGGLQPDALRGIVGLRARRDIPRGTAMTRELLEDGG